MGRSPRFGRSTRADASRGGGAAGAAAVRRLEVPDGPRVDRERLLRHRLDVVGSQRAHSVEIGREVAPVADHRPVAELTGLRGHAVRLEDEVGLGAPLRAGQLLGGDGARRRALDLIEERLLELLGGDPAARGGAHREEEGIAEARGSGVDARGQPLLDQPLVEPARPALAQDTREDVERVAVRVERRRRLPRDEHHRQGARAPDDHAPLSALRRLGRVDLGRLGDRLDRAEVLAGQPERVGRRDVADDDRDGVPGPVVGPVVLVDGVPGHVLDVAAPADHRPAVGMRLEGHRGHRLPQEPTGAVLAALELAPDHGHLGVQVSLVDPAVHHAVGLDAHRELEPVGGDRRVVVRPVVVGARVERRAVQEQRAGDLSEPVLARALEEHVLEEMGHSRDARVLVPRADPVPDAEADDRRAPHFLHQHGEAVREHGFLDAGGEARPRERRRPALAASAAGGGARQDEQRQHHGCAPRQAGDSRRARRAHGSQYRASPPARARTPAPPPDGPAEAWYRGPAAAPRGRPVSDDPKRRGSGTDEHPREHAPGADP